MKILILSLAFPYPHSGTQIRVFNILRNLARNHEITLVSLIQEDELRYVPLLESYCARMELVYRPQLKGRERLKSLFTVEGKLGDQLTRLAYLRQGVPFDVARRYFKEYQDKVDGLLRTNAYDIVQVETVFMEPYVNRALIRPDRTKVVLVEIDIAFIRVYREFLHSPRPLKAFKYLQYHMLQRYEQRAWERVDRIAAVSAVDKKIIQDHNPSLKVWVVPNPVDTEYYQPSPQPRTGKELLLIGDLSFPAHIDAVWFFLREIFPRILASAPDARLTLLGRYPQTQKRALREFSMNVELVGYVEDIRPYLERARVVVVPLRIGGGTRIKILTAMAAGVPVVSTTIGCEGIEVVPETEILLADNPQEFAGRVLHLFEDGKLWATLQASGRRLVENHYAWDVIDLDPILYGREETEGVTP
jgi:polysaccharide biosynthesis protein PslH